MVDTCRKPLLEVCDLLDSKRVPVTSNKRIHGPYPYYGANGIQDYVNDYIFDDDLVLLAEDGGNFGSKDKPIAYRVSGKCWVNNHAHVLKPREGLNVDYLCYSLMYYDTKGLVNGATRKKLTQAAMKNIKIPILAYNEQLKIVKRIAVVSTLIKNKKKELGLLDEFVKSRFIEMFGDPLAGNAKWPIHNLCMVADAIDPQPSHRTPPIDENGIPYVSIKDCDYNTGKIDFEKARKVNVTVLQKHKTRYQIHNGDMMIGKIGTIGYPVILPTDETYTLSANVILIQPNKFKVQPYFLKYSLESPYVESQFDKAKHSTSQSAFGILKLRKIKVMNPELSIQNQFADFVHQVDKSKMAVQKSLDELETLKKSLMQTYFG